MKTVAGLVGLGDAGEGAPIAALGEPTQQSRVQLAATAGTVMIDVDIDAGLGRPLVGSQAIECVSVGEADDPITAFEDEPFVGVAGGGDARSHLSYGRDFDFPTDRRVQDIRAVNGNAGGRIVWGSRTHQG